MDYVSAETKSIGELGFIHKSESLGAQPSRAKSQQNLIEYSTMKQQLVREILNVRNYWRNFNRPKHY